MEEEAFRRAFREHKESIFAFTYRLTGSTTAADDLTQDGFLELFLKPDRFDPERAVTELLVGQWRGVNNDEERLSGADGALRQVSQHVA